MFKESSDSGVELEQAAETVATANGPALVTLHPWNGATPVTPFGFQQYSGSSSIGRDLTPADLTALEARWIDPELARRARLRRADSLTGGEIVGRKGGDYSGVLIPYFQPGSDQVRDYRLRRDHPDLEHDAGGNLKIRQKYLSPPGRTNMLYLPPGVPQSLLRDAAMPVVNTEVSSSLSPSGAPPTMVLRVGLAFCRWEYQESTTGGERLAKPLGPMAAA